MSRKIVALYTWRRLSEKRTARRLYGTATLDEMLQVFSTVATDPRFEKILDRVFSVLEEARRRVDEWVRLQGR